MALRAPAVEPWYDFSNETISVRPVERLANLNAPSMASAPELVKYTLSKEPPKASTKALA
jgi:hypothetical protein